MTGEMEGRDSTKIHQAKYDCSNGKTRCAFVMLFEIQGHLTVGERRKTKDETVQSRDSNALTASVFSLLITCFISIPVNPQNLSKVVKCICLEEIGVQF